MTKQPFQPLQKSHFHPSKTNSNVADNKNKTNNKNKNKTNNKSETNNEILTAVSVDDEFEFVWNLYDRKGNKKTSRLKFNKMSDTNKRLMADHVTKYVLSTPDKQFRKNLETYINQECWNDEITSNQQSFQSGKTSGNLANCEDFING